MYSFKKPIRTKSEVPLMQEYSNGGQFDELSVADQHYLRLKKALKSSEMLSLQHAEVEQRLKTEGFEVLRLLMQEYLDERADQEPELEKVTGADGIERTHCRENCGRGFETLFGAVRVNRRGYSARNQSSLFPLDGELNLPDDSYSHGLRKQAVQEVAGRSFDRVVDSIDRTTGGHVPKRQVENIAEDVTQFFEEFYQSRTAQAEETGDPLIMSTDAKGIKMRKDALREATRKAAEKKEGKYKVRLSKGEKSNSKRMAQVGAVYSITKEVRHPEDIMRAKDERVVDLKPRARARNKRVWASVARDPGEVINELFEEAKRRDPDMKRPLAMLIDGNGSQLESIKTCMKLHKAEHTTLILDFVHVLEYLWKAAYSFHPEGSEEAENWVRERGLKILQGKASSVARGMQQSATKRRLKAGKRKAVKKCHDYLLKYADLLRYNKYLAQGLPIATGVIEGACRHLVKDRMDLTGARWGLARAEAVLKTRALESSGDFEKYFEFYKEKSLQKVHASQYQSIPWQKAA